MWIECEPSGCVSQAQTAVKSVQQHATSSADSSAAAVPAANTAVTLASSRVPELPQVNDCFVLRQSRIV